MANIELIIFDCDGVLVDSEPIANRTLALMLEELGLRLTQAEIFEHFVGYSIPHCLQVIERLLGRPPPGTFRNDLQIRTFAAFRSELRAMPGVREALERLEQPCCVASSGDHEKMRTTLGITGLLPRFEGRLFSVTEVANGKPAPDVYLHAAARCGADPRRCIVVEDTPPGVKAGAAAGMTVFGFCAHTPKDMLLRAGAHLTFDRMDVLPDLVRDA
jgi:HAD superfamily hydrolase (TIGR01509 family)